MNWTGIIRFFTRGAGLMALIMLAIFGVCYYVGKAQLEKHATEAKKNENDRQVGKVVQEPTPVDTVPKEQELQNRSLMPVNRRAAPEVTQQPAARPESKAALLRPALLSFYEDVQTAPTPTPTPEVHAKPEVWLPPTIFVPCVLVNTVESSHINTPVVGKVEQDIVRENNGVRRIIIPRGTVVSCFAQSGSVRDRIEVSGTWKFVFPDGRQLEVPGVACTREADPTTQQFGIEDGSAGLEGEIIESDHYANFKALVALLTTATVQAGTAAAGSALQANHGASFTTLPDTTPILQTYLAQLLNGSTGDARFVRVRASSEFYIFPTEAILPTHRTITTERVVANTAEQAPSDPVQAATQIERQLMRDAQPQPTPQVGNPSPNMKF
jgi:hypothetical protein